MSNDHFYLSQQCCRSRRKHMRTTHGKITEEDLIPVLFRDSSGSSTAEAEEKLPSNGNSSASSPIGPQFAKLEESPFALF